MRIANLERLTPIYSGITPVILFSVISKTFKFVQFFKDDGSSPTKLFLLSFNVSREAREPIVVGIFPENALLLRSRMTRFSKCFQQFGSSPEKELLDRSRNVKFLALLVHKKDSSPKSLLLERSTDATFDGSK